MIVSSISMLATIISTVAFITVLRSALQYRREAMEARMEARLWQIAVVETMAEWVQTEHGEEGVKRWREFARYTPPEVVRENLPLPRSTEP